MLYFPCINPTNTMNKILRYGLLCVVFLAFGIIANAQDELDASYTGKIETKYDQGKNESEITLGFVPLSIDKGKKALLHLSVSFAGKNMKEKPDSVTVVVSVINAKGHRYPDINPVILNSGGKEIGRMILLNLDQRALSESDIVETFGTAMKKDVFRKLAASKQAIIFKVAETTFTIGTEYIPKLAEFEKAFNP